MLAQHLADVVPGHANLLLGEDTAKASVRRPQQRQTIVAIVFQRRLHRAAVVEHTLIRIVRDCRLVLRDKALREVHARRIELVGQRGSEDMRVV